MTRIVGGIFCLSGAAALVFETLWFRQAGLAFGNTVWASSIVLASFMAGLALGNALAARFGHRVQRPLLAYAVLEVLVGSAGLVLVWNLAQLGPLLAPFLGQFVDNPVLLNVLRLVIAFFLLLVPATAMGATLPLLVKLLRAYDPSFGSALGKLYGWNAAGAVVGALAGEVALIEWFGIRGTAAFALFMDGVAALGALLLSRRFESAPARARRQGRKPQKLASDDAARVTTWTFDATRFLCAAALAGGILLALEVLWFRFLLLFVHSGSLTFPMMLAVVLAGISLGGFFAGTWLRHREGAHRNASNVAFLAGASVVVLYRAFSLAYAPYGTEYIDEPRVILWLSVVLMLLGSTLSGVLFTLTGTALRGTMQPETRAVGLLTLANTLGATAGALIAGFVCIPFLGMERSFFGAAALYGIVGLVLLRRRAAQATPRRRYIAYVAPTLFVGTLVLFPFGLMQEHYFRVPVRRYDPDATMQVVATREGRSETVTYLRKDFAGEPEYYKMLTNGFSMSGTRPGSRRYMKLYAYLPVALHPDPKRALLISYGVGSTAKALTDTPSLESIDVVDISKEILEMSDIVFPNPTEHPLNDPRVRVHVEDGRYFLQTQDQLYDVITGEPPPLKVAGVINLYTREYFQLIYDHLAAGGIHTYWLPVDNLSDEDMGAVIGAYCDVFEDCSLWNGWRLQWMLAGSRRGGARATEESFGRQWRDPRVVDELTALGIEIPEQLGALFMADASVLREFAGRVEPLTDNFPKRLSNTIFAPDAALQRHARWMRTGPAREHFLTSDAILRTWPAALLERTLPYFDFQRIVNEVSVRPGARGTPERFFGDLHTILTGSPLRTLVLWHLGVSADVPSLVDRRIEAGDAPDAYARQLAIRALANRDYDAAATWFAAAVVKQPSDRFLEQCHLYSLLMAGRPDQARAAAETAFESRSPDGGDRSFWGWVQQTLDLDPPETIAM